ncbi:MAG: homoserine O-succinyltransferase [Pseudomonadota bacterium]
MTAVTAQVLEKTTSASRKQAPSPHEIFACDIHVPAPSAWIGSVGATLPPETRITLRFTGPEHGPLVAVMGGISSGRCVADAEDATGWWSEIAADGAAIDLSERRVVSMDFVGGDGETELELTPSDQATLFAHALDVCGVDRLDAFVGCSFGGMVGLAFARAYPERLGRLIIISAAHRPSAMGQAWRTIQRRILRFAIASGDPAAGVDLARQLAMTTYRTPDEFEDRFKCRDGFDGGAADYLAARGAEYASMMPAARYLTLSGAIDRHFETPEEIKTPVLLIGVENDRLAPLEDMRELDARLAGPSKMITLSSVYGHDAFLKETASIGPIISRYLSEE